MSLPRFVYRVCRSLACGCTRAMQLTGERTRDGAGLYEAAECLTCGRVDPFAFVVEHAQLPADEAEAVLHDHETARRTARRDLPS